MIIMKKTCILLLLLLLSSSCGTYNSGGTDENLERMEFPGCGLVFEARTGQGFRFMESPEASGIVQVRDSTSAPRLVMRVFDLPTGRIEDLFAILDLNEDCVFHEVESGRRRVSRYVLEPSEKCAAEEAVPSTCGRWGVGNSGMRYFEVHKAVPDKAVFVEIGQEQPLFDPESIRFARP